MLRLAGLLDALPLPPGSAQADMVATSIAQRATLPERKVCAAQPLAFVLKDSCRILSCGHVSSVVTREVKSSCCPACGRPSS
jgi:hypothetical protein